MARTAFCGWAAEDPPDEVKIRTIRERSRRGENPDPIPNAYPSLATMAGDALAAVGRAAAAAATGGPVLVPAEVYHQRLAICRTCEHFDPGPGRCKQCGCFMAGVVAGKARMAQESCPVGKWPKWERPTDGPESDA